MHRSLPAANSFCFGSGDVNHCATQQVAAGMSRSSCGPIRYWWSSIYLWLSITSALIPSPAVWSCCEAVCLLLHLFCAWSRPATAASCCELTDVADLQAEIEPRWLLRPMRLPSVMFRLSCPSSCCLCLHSVYFVPPLYRSAWAHQPPAARLSSVYQFLKPATVRFIWTSADLQASDTEAWRFNAVGNRFWWSRLWLSHSCETETYNVLFSCFLPDYSKGFGGKFGVQNDRMDKVRSVSCVWMCVMMCRASSHLCLRSRQSAGTFDEVEKPTSSYQKTKPVEAGEFVNISCVSIGV